MGKKNIQQDGLSAILGNINEDLQTPEPQAITETVCFRCTTDRIAKIRTIAREKGLSLKDVMQAAIDLALDKYEKRNGEIEIKPLKGNLEDIFK